MFDYHMHSDFSADCSIPMEDMITRAIDKGLTEICFTEHIDYDYPDPNYIFEFDLQAYDQKIKQVQEKYKSKIRIKKGIELGLQPHLIQRYNQLMQEESFDFAICSMHTTDHMDLHSGDLFKNKTLEEAYAAYYDELLTCVKEFKQFSVLGHLDLVKRYTIDEQPSNLFHEQITAIFKEIIPAGKGIELNTSGVRYGMPNGLPSDDILKLYKQCGGEIITLGSDSHYPDDLAFQFKESLELLSSIGFKYITSFENKDPKFHAIDQLSI